jgi:hypothetical protein
MPLFEGFWLPTTTCCGASGSRRSSGLALLKLQVQREVRAQAAAE